MDTYEIIGLGIPHPKYDNECPEDGVLFGVHYASSKEDAVHYLDIGPRRCKGMITLREGEARCQCGFWLRLGKDYREALSEWRKITLGAGLAFLPFFPGMGPLRKPGVSWFSYMYNGSYNGSRYIGEPETHPVGSDFKKAIQSMWADTPSWFDLWAGFIDSSVPVWVWNYRGIAVAKVLELGTTVGAHHWGLSNAVLLREMEQQFQTNIKKAAQLAASASESFHPKTRRPKQ